MSEQKSDYDKIGLLVHMGFDASLAIDALASCGGDVSSACDYLMNQQRPPEVDADPSGEDLPSPSLTGPPDPEVVVSAGDESTAPSTVNVPSIPDPGSAVSLLRVSAYPDLSSIPKVVSPSSKRKWYAPSDYGDDDDDSSNVTFFYVFFPLWSGLTEAIRDGITKLVVTLSVMASLNPKRVIFSITFFSFAVCALGFFTNFTLLLDLPDVFTPLGSKPEAHSKWIDTGFPDKVDPLAIIIQRGGNNVLNEETVRRSFAALDTVRNSTGYHELCAQGGFVDAAGDRTCRIFSVTRFWDHDLSKFEQEILLHKEYGYNTADDYIQASLSKIYYPDGTPIAHEQLLGNFLRQPDDNLDDDSDGLINFAESLLLVVYLPDTLSLEATVVEFNRKMLRNMRRLRSSWLEDPEIPDELDFLNLLAYRFEFERGVVADAPLVFVVFVVMVGFTCSFFYRNDKVHSRSTLGLGSVVTIVMSILSSFGIMFICGVPFTMLTLILPFVVVGVGLDDTFIITGEYFRTDPKLPTEERVRECMEEVGVSITLTTTTTCLAFLLGFQSSLPGVRWLCIYAFVTLFIDFIYQITYFMALITLNERRVQARKRDCCCCISVPLPTEGRMEFKDTVAGMNPHNTDLQQQNEKTEKHIADRFMIWYGNVLLHPISKVVVLSFFGFLVGSCCFSVTKLKQDFRVADYLPVDSYIRGFLANTDIYSDKIWSINIYFRNIDQSDPDVQNEMIAYVDELSQMPQIGREPDFCWVKDFQSFSSENGNQGDFNSFLDLALNTPVVREVFGPDIIRDEVSGNITASRCYLFLRNLDLGSVLDQRDMLLEQRDITTSQRVNQGKDDWSFFTFDPIYFFWEAYVVSVDELIFTMISGIIAVSVVALLLMPHWSAVFFVTPMIMIMYISYLGTIQFFGLAVNGLTYICVVISIGLLVDFIMHILLRYYEMPHRMPREQKVKRTLETMGASMLVGGLTTFLGVCPLFFSTTAIFQLVFTALWTLVALGCINGLILLPVILSIFGPALDDPCDMEIEVIRTTDDDVLALNTFNNSSTTNGSQQAQLPLPPKIERAPLPPTIQTIARQDRFAGVPSSSDNGSLDGPDNGVVHQKQQRNLASEEARGEF